MIRFTCRLLLIGALFGLAMSRELAAQGVDPRVLEAESRRAAVMEQASRTAVCVFADGGTNGGSGVVISADGYALTNFHVVQPAGNWMKCGMADGRLYDAVIVGIDPVGDVALIKLLGRDDFPAAPLADSDRVRAGDWVFCVGNPFLLATDFQPTVSYGIVSGVHRYQYPAGTLLEYADCIQTDAAINPGNSGGPLFNDQGEVIGINGRGSFEKRGRVNVGVGYAISINQIKHFLGHLRGGRIVDHASLGATVSTSDDGRVLVTDILEDSDAYRRGLRYGDEIARFGGRAIRTTNAFKNVLGIFPRDWQTTLTYRRQGESHDVVVRLAGVHAPGQLLELISGRRPADHPPRPEGPPDPEKPAPPEDKPQQPERRPPGGAPAARQPKPMPDVIKPVYQPRRGFANYHFNLVERSRAWQLFSTRGDFTTSTGSWRFTGTVDPAGEVDLELDDKSARLTLPGGALKLDVQETLTDAVQPPGSGGLLAALYLWRRLLQRGPADFGEVSYLGVMPLPERDMVPCDVLSALHAGVECHAFITPAGELARFDLYLRADDDPCQLLFSDYVEEQGRSIPRRVEVHYGNAIYAVLHLTRRMLTTEAQP